MAPNPDSTRGIRIAVTADYLTATLVVDAGLDPSTLSEEVVDALVADRGVTAIKDRAQTIRQAVQGFADHEGDHAYEFVLARGRAPEHGADGYIQFEPGLDPSEAGNDEPKDHAGDKDDDEAIDYYSQSAYTVVTAGQLIGRVLEPSTGVEGYDVTGKILAAKDGRPFDVETDGSVTVDRDNRLIAAKSGIIDYANTRLRILDELEVTGNVDFSTGHIDFPGSVHVGQGIKDRFEVKVGGSLTVRELVEAATITVAVDCVLQRGMASRGKGVVKCGRDLSATYLDNSRVIVGRDLNVVREISGCTSQVSRRVCAPSAALIGGSLVAGHACELAQLGSESGTPTTVALGRLPEIDHLAAKTAEMLPECRKEATRCRKRLETLTAHGTNLTTDQTEELITLQRSTPEAELRLSRIRDALERLWLAHRDNTLAELTVAKIIYAGVRLHIGGFEATITQDVKGPVVVWLDDGTPKAGDPDRSRVFPLSSVANVVESGRFPDLEALARDPQGANAA